MSVYRRSSIPAPLRTEVTTDDLRHLDVVMDILRLLNEPAAGAVELARLVDRMPVLAARLGGSKSLQGALQQTDDVEAAKAILAAAVPVAVA